jgi:Tfp pilus assembly protein PilV
MALDFSCCRMAASSVQEWKLSLASAGMPHADRGVALLEAMIAVAILAGAGLAAADLVSTALRAEVEAEERERELGGANRLLAAMTLLRKDDLDRRIGRHRSGSLVAAVQRTSPGLYRIAVATATRPEVELLMTVVHKPEPAR